MYPAPGSQSVLHEGVRPLAEHTVAMGPLAKVKVVAVRGCILSEVDAASPGAWGLCSCPRPRAAGPADQRHSGSQQLEAVLARASQGQVGGKGTISAQKEKVGLEVGVLVRTEVSGLCPTGEGRGKAPI